MFSQLHIRKSLFIVVIFLTISCNNSSKFTLEKEFLSYLNEVFYIESKKSLYVFFLQSKSCGSCTNSALNIINNIYNQNNLPYIILAGKDDRITKWLSFHPYLLETTFVDTTWQFEKYGLRFSDHCFFHIVNNKIFFSFR